MGVFMLLIHVFLNAGLFILKAFKSASEVSMFYAPNNLFFLICLIPVSILSGYFPELSRSANKDIKIFFQKYEKAFKFFSFIGIFIAALFAVLPEKIILLFYGREFLGSLPVFRILSANIIFLMLVAVFDFTLVAMKRQSTLILCLTGGLIAKVILDLLLIPRYSYVGASIASVSGCFIYFAATFFMVSRKVGIVPVWKYILSPLLLAGIIGASFSLVYQWNVVVLSVAGFLMYGVCLFLAGYFSQNEICFLKNAVKNMLERIQFVKREN